MAVGIAIILLGTGLAFLFDKPFILKQLHLRGRLLVLDEPTPVLTPAEADEMLACYGT